MCPPRNPRASTERAHEVRLPGEQPRRKRGGPLRTVSLRRLVAARWPGRLEKVVMPSRFRPAHLKLSDSSIRYSKPTVEDQEAKGLTSFLYLHPEVFDDWIGQHIA